MNKTKQLTTSFFIILTVTILDLYSKHIIFTYLYELAHDNHLDFPLQKITGFFNLVSVWNYGVSFGMLNNFTNGKYFILITNSIILIILFIWLYRNKKLYITIALSFIIAGALGNSIDRIINGAVADFLDFHLFNYHFPAFNIADSSVFIGVCMLLFEDYIIKFINSKKDAKN